MGLRYLLPLFVLATQYANALIRFPCGQLVTERLDPLVVPGVVSPHLHQIIGGNAFNITMDPNLDLPTAATCTTCKFKEDKSNYWTAVMYFKYPNGTFARVPQMANHLQGSQNGGMTVYYIQPTNKAKKVKQFPKGFRMLAGDPFLRSKPNINSNSPEAWASSFRCWQTPGFTDADNSSPPGASTQYDTVTLPAKPCKYGIRSHLFFPACWDGKNLDSTDHKSHMAYFQGNVNAGAGIILMEGTCPSTHPVRMPLLFYETVWDTRPFVKDWPANGPTPLVLSMGDPTGYGHHGDYVFGWEGDSLQRAMDNCFDTLGLPDSCKTLTQVSDADMNKCTKATVVPEKVEGVLLKSLPGCNPVQNGPGRASVISGCDAVSTTIGAAAVATPTVPDEVIAPAAITAPAAT